MQNAPRCRLRAFISQAEAYRYRVVDLSHCVFIKLTHALAQAGFVDSPYLLKKDHTVPRQADALGVQLNMGGQPCLAGLTRYGSGNNRWAVLIAGVVLNYEHRAHTALLRAHNGAQVGIIDISTFDYTQFNSHSE